MFGRIQIALLGLSLVFAGVLAAQRPREERIGDGYLITVLPRGALQAIDEPHFVPREEAEKFMADREPVLGVFDGQVAKAYSLWHLDRHEVVNDSTPGLGPIAVTW